jgi:hypothetical protein
MESQEIAQVVENDANAPATLTAEQTEIVSGGALAVAGFVRGGCPTCTSGSPIAFMNIAAVINPAPTQAFG